jgi:hypothetical protein
VTLNIAVAFLLLAFCLVVTGVLLWCVPAGLIVAGVLLAAAGVGLLERPSTAASQRAGGAR